MKKPSTCPVVLHVVERPTEAASELDLGVAHAGFDVLRVDTVYGATARLARPNGQSVIKAVLVCADALEASELAFFALAAKRWPEIPVYVYGQSTDGARRQRALALGAASEVVAGRIDVVLADLVEQAKPEESAIAETSRPSTSESERQPEESIAKPTPIEHAKADEQEEAREAVSRESAEEASVESEPEKVSPRFDTQQDRRSAGKQVPTPWQPASERPKRVPPGSGSGVRESQDWAQARPAAGRELSGLPTSADEPLLSPQEMDALLKHSRIINQVEEATEHGRD